MTKSSAMSFIQPFYGHAAVSSEGGHFPVQGLGVFLGLVDGDDAPALKKEVDAVADNFHASINFRVPAPTSIYHIITSLSTSTAFWRGAATSSPSG